MDMNREFKNLIALENGIKELIEKNWENEKLYDRTLIILNYFQFNYQKTSLGYWNGLRELSRGNDASNLIFLLNHLGVHFVHFVQLISMNGNSFKKITPMGYINLITTFRLIKVLIFVHFIRFIPFV